MPCALEALRITGKRILIVEDDPDLQRVLIDVLTLEGSEPTAVTTGADAIAQLDSQDFDLVLLDLNLPDMTGWQVLEHIRATKAGLPVVILTANAAVASRQRALVAGAVDYVVKPVAIRELVVLLRRHLNAPSAAD